MRLPPESRVGSTMLAKAPRSWTPAEAAHLLRRAGFGAAPSEISRVHALGREAAVDSMFMATDPEDAFPDPAWADPDQLRASLRDHFEKTRELRRQIDSAGEDAEPADGPAEQLRNLQRDLRQRSARQGFDIQRIWWKRILNTRAPLREKMTVFWHDHFATSLQKVRSPWLMLEQNHLFRQQAFGSFRELTHAIVTNPATMIYLDVQRSRKGRPNENFARELFELFTLGEGNYSESDVREAARAFTGYQYDRITGAVRHNRRQWDAGEKNLFGRTGTFAGKDVVDLLFRRDEPSEFISRKLWEYFVCENAPPAVVHALAEILRNHDHRVEPALRAIFLSREFYREEVIGSQIKSPVQFLAQLIRELESPDPPPFFFLTAQNQLGQVLYHPPNVAGWDHGKAWINTNTLLARYNLAGFIVTGSDASAKALDAPGMRGGAGSGVAARRSARRWNGPDYETLVPREMRGDPEAVVAHLVSRFALLDAPARARESFSAFATAKHRAILTNKEIGELCHLMLSTPYYQLC